MFRLGCTLGSINGWVPQTWRIPTSPFQGSGAKFVEEGQKMSEVFFIFRGWPPQKGRAEDFFLQMFDVKTVLYSVMKSFGCWTSICRSPNP